MPKNKNINLTYKKESYAGREIKMILTINTSGTGLDFVLDNKTKHVDTEKQSLSLPLEAEKFLQENNTKWSDLTAIGVVVGPGSFTGIRLGIAYAKGLGMGLNIPVIPITAFELYLFSTPDAFVAIDSGKGDFFVAANGLEPCVMTIDEIETKQMEWKRTIGHKPFEIANATAIVKQKLENGDIQPAVPLYLRPSYAEQNSKCTMN